MCSFYSESRNRIQTLHQTTKVNNKCPSLGWVPGSSQTQQLRHLALATTTTTTTTTTTMGFFGLFGKKKATNGTGEPPVLTDETIAIVKSTAPAMNEHAYKISETMYQNMFAEKPEVSAFSSHPSLVTFLLTLLSLSLSLSNYARSESSSPRRIRKRSPAKRVSPSSPIRASAQRRLTPPPASPPPPSSREEAAPQLGEGHSGVRHAHRRSGQADLRGRQHHQETRREFSSAEPAPSSSIAPALPRADASPLPPLSLPLAQVRWHSPGALPHCWYEALPPSHPSLSSLGPLTELTTVLPSSPRLLSRPGHYLIGAVKEVLGDAATADIVSAWTQAYEFLAHLFIKTEAGLYAKQ